MKPSLGQFVDRGSNVAIDLPRLLETRALIQASSGYGKSWALRRLLEVTAGSVQQLVVDPEGEFPSLREKFDLVICAAHDADALAHPKTARLLATRLLETQASAVLDLSELKAPDRHTFVKLFLESLIEAPKILRHSVLVALDEAQMFCPEKGQGESEATDAVIDLASRGRKRGLCLVAATQRIGKFHKSAAAELKNKLIGSCSLDVDVKRAAFELGLPPKEALALLRALEPGHFYGFGPALNQVEPRELKVGAIETTHPKVGHRASMKPPAPTEAIKALLPKLADLPKEAEQQARTVDDLKRELANTRRELTQARQMAGNGTPADQRKALIEAEQRGNERGRMAGFGEGHAEAVKSIRMALQRSIDLLQQDIVEAFSSIRATPPAPDRSGIHPRSIPVKTPVKTPVSTGAKPGITKPFKSHSYSGNGADEPLPRGERAILGACIQFPEGLERNQLTVLTGYKRSTRDAYIQRLAEKGFVDVGDRISATEAGRGALPDFEPLPTGQELQRYWFQRLPEGESKILQALVDRHPDPVQRDELTELTGYKRSTRDAYIQRLAAKELVAEASRGEVRASENLF